MRPGQPFAWLMALALLAGLCARPARAQQSSVFNEARSALDRLELSKAAELLEGAKDDASPASLRLRALLAFHEGDYDQAVSLMDALGKAMNPLPPHLLELQGFIQAAAEMHAQMEEVRSSDGRYRVAYSPRDRLLAPYALDALERADRALTGIFGRPVRGPIRLEIYAGPKALARVSSLTEAHIETTGTVALSKWNRLMVTSPRALLRGYPWLDTVCHELVHMVLAELSGNEAPVWVHEGLAKLMERVWRGEKPAPLLSPASQAALIKAAKTEGLIPFAQLHPSIAMLPSQDAASLAFAQVATFMQTLYARRGNAGIEALTARLERGEDAQQAVGDVWGEGFASIEATWKQGQAKQPTPPDPPSLIKLRFRGAEDAHHDESLDVAEEHARRHVRLGDMLWTRGHKKASSREYQKAQAYAPDDAVLASRLGRTAIEAGEPARALQPLSRAIQRQPSYAPLRSLLGEAALDVGDAALARAQLGEALRINPFDPTPHCGLAKLDEDPWERRVCQHLQRGESLALPADLKAVTPAAR